MLRKCEWCICLFDAPAKEVKRGNGRFCSLSCSARSNARKVSDAKQLNVTCAYCGEGFYKAPSKMKKSKSGLFFCCRRHKDLANRLDGLKEIHPPHFGTGTGITTYRQVALSHYGSKCNRCGYIEHIGVLQVHHQDRNRTNNDLSNLEVLCPTCHEVHHLLEGTGRWSAVRDSNPQPSACKTDALRKLS